ncbi:hypothetical protein K0M31_002722 [Melipona bicolor]|uniref:Uncharacterized protein n=1 Tax=Melipona bicolor TaxID=60889 RepID=A0AA40FZL7_9HYME|nr:hypothetical protein K0M31_002722 [Melipona bicolor]
MVLVGSDGGGRSESRADTSAASRLPGRLMNGEQQSFSIRGSAGLATKMGGWTAARVRGNSVGGFFIDGESRRPIKRLRG